MNEPQKRHGVASLAVILGGACTLAFAIIAAAQAAMPGEIGPSRAEAAEPEPVIEAEAPEGPPAIAFQSPVPGRKIISPWGLRQLPWEERGRLHEGVDIAGNQGEKILAVADGVVTRKGVGGGYGTFVEIRHDGGLTSFYAHLGSVDRRLRVGRAVRAGQPVARMGNGGSSTGPHLHLEIRHQGEPVNPILFLGRRFATLDALPVEMAQTVSPRVRIAYVSTIPESKRGAMKARLVKAKSKHRRLPQQLRLAEAALKRSGGD